MTRYVVLTGLGLFIGVVIAGATFGVLPEPTKKTILCAFNLPPKGDCQ